MSKKKLSMKTAKSNVDKTKKTFVFLMKDIVYEHELQSSYIVHLKHPGSEQPSMFLFSHNNIIHEVMSFSEENRSWFIDDVVLSDGKFYLSTPIDPIFLVLPYLKKNCNKHAMPLYQVLIDEEFPDNKRLLNCSGLDFLYLVADKKGTDDMNAYKYNEEKTLSWLKKKVKMVMQVLEDKNIYVGSGAISTTFIKSDVLSDGKNRSDYLSFSYGLISEYLSEELSVKLFKYLGLLEETNKRKKGPVTPQKNDAKKSKIEVTVDSSELMDINKTESGQKILSTKKKALAKAAIGTKTISSFFKKK